MQEVFKWLLDNWRIVLEVVLLIASVVIALSRKKSVSDITSWIYKYAIEAINSVEAADIIGSDKKLKCAVEIVSGMLCAIFPNIKKGSYNNLIASVIEEILKTPQKKGDK